jgi:hypothetical protein
MTTHLDRLLFAQGGQCFFCRKPLPKAEASVEHLVASANGGTNDDGNWVACGKALNHLLNSKSIKDKVQIVLNQRGNFLCPDNVSPQPNPETPHNWLHPSPYWHSSLVRCHSLRRKMPSPSTIAFATHHAQPNHPSL